MRYDTRHGFGGYERQLHPRGEKVLLVAMTLLMVAIWALLIWG